MLLEKINNYYFTGSRRHASGGRYDCGILCGQDKDRSAGSIEIHHRILRRESR